MFKNIINTLKYNNILFNPIIKYLAKNIDIENTVNKFPREIPIVIILSPKFKDLKNIELTIYSIFNQTLRADNIILLLNHDEYKLSELPYSITRYIKNGLEIKFSSENNDTERIINMLDTNKEKITVLASDGIYYHKKWLETLYHSYIANPNDIQVNNAALVNIIEERLYLSCNCFYDNAKKASFKYFPIIVGGILFPPDCFIQEVNRKDIYKNVPLEVWLWIIAIISNRKFRIVDNCINKITHTNFKSLLYFNKFSQDDFINNQAGKLMKYYKYNIMYKLND